MSRFYKISTNEVVGGRKFATFDAAREAALLHLQTQPQDRVWIGRYENGGIASAQSIRAADLDAALDRWNDAALAALNGQPCPASDPDSLKGYAHGLGEAKVRPQLPERAEGYYHTPIEVE